MAPENDKVRSAMKGAKIRISEKLGDIWWALMVRGLLAVTLGLAALIWPKITVVLLLKLVGIYVLVDGAIGLFSAMRARNSGIDIVPGVISVAVGLILLFWPDTTGRVLMIIIGVWAMIQGGSLFWAGFRSDNVDPERRDAINVGAVIAIAGLVLVLWPGTGAVTISWVIGIAALLVGGLLIYLGWRLRRLAERIA